MEEQSVEYICRFCGWKGTNIASTLEKTDDMQGVVFGGGKCPKCDCEVEMLNIITIVKEIIRTWRKINHIRTRSYVLISLSTLAFLFFIPQIFFGLEVKELRFEFDSFDNSYLNDGIGYILTILSIFGSWIIVFTFCRTFLNIFAFTTKDTNNAKLLPYYQNIIDFHVGELTPRMKADFLLEHSTKEMLDTRLYNPTWFRKSKPKGYDFSHIETENDLMPRIWATYMCIFVLTYFYYYFEPANAMKLFDIYLFYWLAIGPCLSATICHILVSFIDVKSSINNDIAKEFAEEYVKFQEQSFSDSSSEID